MPTKKELLYKIKNGDLKLLPEYLELEYTEIKERLVDQLNDDELKRLQGEARRLRELIKLTK